MANNNKNKTAYHYFKGTAKYINTRKPDDYGNYSIRLEFADEAEKTKFEQTGIQVKILDDGNSVYFRRPDTKIFNKELVEMGPPVVLDKDNNPLKELVGSGSQVIVKVRSYDTIKGKGHTLDAIKVIDLTKVAGSSTGEYFDF